MNKEEFEQFSNEMDQHLTDVCAFIDVLNLTPEQEKYLTLAVAMTKKAISPEDVLVLSAKLMLQ